MATEQGRDYACKDEEVPVTCDYAHFSFKRDLADFKAYSPKFDDEYDSNFGKCIDDAYELVAPESETIELKASTTRLYAVYDGLRDPINRLEGYLQLAEKKLNVSPDDFGIKVLRKSIRKKDAEGVLDSLHLINRNVITYRSTLVEMGLNDNLINRFVSDAEVVSREKKLQYEIVTNRRRIVQENLFVLNNLNHLLVEILRVGKILYSDSDTAKTKEYTFSELKKRVRHDMLTKSEKLLKQKKQELKTA